jgi:hypothetical protein
MWRQEKLFDVGRYKDLCRVDNQQKSPKYEQWNKSRTLSQEDMWGRINSFRRGALQRVILLRSSVERELPKF